jgi:uncharacterized protein YfiM (DUF2279 family)
MFKVSYQPIDHTVQPVEIAIANMRSADQTYDSSLFVAASNGWLRAMNAVSKTNYKDLEIYLRAHAFNTHLFPKKVPVKKNQFIGIQYIDGDSTVYTYQCIVSCRPLCYAVEELLSVWPSYEESFKNLSKAGMLMSKQTNYSADRSFTQHIGTKADYLGAVSMNQCMATIQYIEADQVIGDLEKAIREKYGKDPVLKPVAKTDQGELVMAFTVGGQVVDKNGIVICVDASGKKMVEMVELSF